jgi:hypothetical protein
MVSRIDSIHAARQHVSSGESGGGSAEHEGRRESKLHLGQHVRISCLIVTHKQEIGVSVAGTVKLPFRKLNSILVRAMRMAQSRRSAIRLDRLDDADQRSATHSLTAPTWMPVLPGSASTVSSAG